MSATTTTKAPVGPPIWYREPPSAEIRKPATIGAVNARLGRHAGRDGERHREGERDEADRDAGEQVGDKLVAGVIPEEENRFRKPGLVHERQL